MLQYRILHTQSHAHVQLNPCEVFYSHPVYDRYILGNKTCLSLILYDFPCINLDILTLYVYV